MLRWLWLLSLQQNVIVLFFFYFFFQQFRLEVWFTAITFCLSSHFAPFLFCFQNRCQNIFYTVYTCLVIVTRESEAFKMNFMLLCSCLCSLGHVLIASIYYRLTAFFPSVWNVLKTIFVGDIHVDRHFLVYLRSAKPIPLKSLNVPSVPKLPSFVSELRHGAAVAIPNVALPCAVETKRVQCSVHSHASFSNDVPGPWRHWFVFV